MAASRYASKATPALAKKKLAAVTKHLQAPLKGLSLNSQMVTNDAYTASVLDNWIVEKDRITVRPGLKKLLTLPGGLPLETIIPFYGQPNSFLLASGGVLYSSSGAALVSGLGSNDWNWTAFSNLGERDYTVMVNGANGVFSWDGGTTADPGGSVAVVSLSNSNPAVVTVAAANIGRFASGMMVTIAGAAGTGMTAANGTHQISSVNSPANTFRLNNVDTSTASAPQTTGVTVDPLGSIFPENVVAPTGKPYVDPTRFHTVLSHMNRLWFADRTNLAIYYLPLQQKSGVLKELPLNAVFRRGGYIKAIYTWTLDGGAGVEDQLVLFSSNGEAIVYGGTDPDSDFQLTGIFRFDSPMSMKSVINYGGDLYAFISTGLVPMSTMLRAESEQLGTADKNITDLFAELTDGKADVKGWQVLLDYNTGWAICNFPSGAANRYRQLVRFMPDPIWTSWSAIPSRCWQWLNRRLYCGSDDGILYEMTPAALNDDGKPIVADMMLTWSMFNTPALKKFQMVRPYVITDGASKPYVDIRVDYDDSAPFNQPDAAPSVQGAEWDLATWDVDYWAQTPKAKTLWNGVSAIGNVAAPRLKVAISNCLFSVAGFDVVYEIGGVVG